MRWHVSHLFCPFASIPCLIESCSVFFVFFLVLGGDRKSDGARSGAAQAAGYVPSERQGPARKGCVIEHRDGSTRQRPWVVFTDFDYSEDPVVVSGRLITRCVLTWDGGRVIR